MADVLTNFLQHYKYDRQTKQSVQTLWTHWRRNYERYEQPGELVSETCTALREYSKQTPLADRRDVLLYLQAVLQHSLPEERENILDECARWISIAMPEKTVGSGRALDHHWKTDCTRECGKKMIAEALVQIDVHAAFRHPTDFSDDKAGLRASAGQYSTTKSPKDSYFTFAASHGAESVVSDLLAKLQEMPDAQINLIKYHEAVNKATQQKQVETVRRIVEFCHHNRMVEAVYQDNVVYKTLIIDHNDSEPTAEILHILLKNDLENHMDTAVIFQDLISNGKVCLLQTFMKQDSFEGCKAFSKDTLLSLIKNETASKDKLWKLCWTYWQIQNFRGSSDLFSVERETNDFLYEAVVKKREPITKDLLEHFPYLAAKSDCRGRHPLKDVTDMDDNIRDHIVSAMISTVAARDLQDMMREWGKPMAELALNLSDFDPSESDFKRFVDCMTGSIDDGNEAFAKIGVLKFEKVLQVVKFPALRRVASANIPVDRADHREVEVVLKWLRDHKVERIQKLIVPDRLHSPHDWKIIHWCARTFQVEELDWRAPDLFLRDCDGECASEEIPAQDRELMCACLQTLKSIRLYSSGNKNTVQQWFSPQGLPALKKLETAEILVINGMLSDSRQPVFERQLLQKLQNLPQINYDDENNCPVQGYNWNSEIGVTQQESISHVSRVPVPELDVFLEKYKDFVADARSKSASLIRPTKVAIIDDGMMPIADGHSLQSQASKQIKGGKSFVFNDEGSSQWFLPGSSSHGTQMACLVSRLDPHCELYIAQVCAPGAPLNKRAVTQAIHWAVHHWKVDVISLSLAFRSLGNVESLSETALENAVEDAEKENVVVICSTMDEGRNVAASEAIPSSYKSTISIVASDNYGAPKEWSQPTDYAYRLLGDSTALGGFKFIKAEATTTGSSVATATASGLASLIISCSYMAFRRMKGQSPNEQNTLTKWKRRAVTTKLDKMCKEDGSRYVQPGNLFSGTQPKYSDMSEEIGRLIDREFCHWFSPR